MHIARIKIRDEATTVKQAKDITNKTLARIKRGIAEYQRSLPDEMAKLREEEKRRAPEKAARQLAILAREQREANAEEFRQQMKEEFPHFIEGDDYIIVAGSIVYGESAPPTPRQRAFKAAFEAFEELRQKDGADMKPAEPQTNGTAKANGKAHDFDPPEWDRPPAQACVDPVDSFVAAITPELPRGALPELIEKVSFAESARMGVDPGVMAMSMLTMCAASIPDQLRLKVKRAVTDRWYQSARLWTMTIGTASTKKSPAQDAAVEPYRGIDIKVRTDSDAAEAAYIDAKKAKDKKDGGDSEIEKPVPKCAIISDISPERAATMMVNNPRGLAVIHDELVSFFGGLDRYGNRGGGAGKAATGMWLSAFNGIGYPIDREGRKTPTGKHMGVSILGSFQPGVIGSLADEGAKHDGLIQRFCYVFAKHVGEGFDRDIDPAHTLEHYDRLIENLYYHMPLGHGHDFHFHEKAHQAKELAFKWINAQLACAEDDNPQLAWHLGKWENIFVRLCLLFHVVEHWSDKVGKPVSVETVRRVDRLMRDYLIPNAAAFYRVLGSDEEIDQIKRACKTILINRRSTITARDLMRSLGRNRKVTRADMERIGSKLETYDWLVRTTGKHNQHNSLQWTVRPEVFSKFAKYVPAFKAEREANRKAMEGAFETQRGKTKPPNH